MRRLCISINFLYSGRMFIRTKRQRKNGKVYVYRVREERYWDAAAKKVRSRYLGRVDDADEAMERALRSAERQAREVDDYQREQFGETGAERATRETNERQWSQEKFLEETKGPAEAGPENSTPSSET